MSEVTFVIPVYNGQRYLNDAIDSVSQQSVSDWRLILVDDCSSDRSREMISQRSDPRITAVYNKSNLGLYGSLLQIFREAHTEWISILMQDDRLKPHYLAEVNQILSSYPSLEALWATEDVIDTHGRLMLKGRDTGRVERIDPGIGPWVNTLKQGCVWTISGSFTRRKLFEDIPFRKDLPHCGDYEWLLRAIRKGCFLYYERSLVELRHHTEQASAGNLRLGIDVDERYRILREAFSRHSDDIPRRTGIEICLKQVRQISKRALISALHLRTRTALKMWGRAISFLGLAMEHSVLHRAPRASWLSPGA